MTMTPTNPVEPPARRAAAGLRDVLERALLRMRDLPRRFERAPLRVALEDAMATLTTWGESPLHAQDHLALLDHAAARVAEASALVRPGSAPGDAARRIARSLDKTSAALAKLREETVDLILGDQDRALRGRTPVHAPELLGARPFLASHGAPRLHVLPGRPRIRPFVEVDAPEPADDEEDDDDTLAPALAIKTSAALPDPLAWDEVAHVRRLARDCMEDIATFGNLRRRNADERWGDVAPFEARLLENLDAFVSLGVVGPECARPRDVLGELIRWADPGFIDKGRAFAAAFVLGSVEGEDAVRAAILSLGRAHPTTFPSYTDAFALAPSPAVRVAMERLTRGEDPALVELGLTVLRRRREVSFAVVAALLGHPSIEVASAAARALGVAEEQEPARQALARWLAEDVDEPIAIAAAESAILLGAPEGLAFLRARLSAERAEPGANGPTFVREAVRLLSLVGGMADAPLVFDILRLEEEGSTAVGWFGDPAHVGPLVEVLGIANEVSSSVGFPAPFEVRTAEALFRITGAPLRVPAEEVPPTEVTTDLVVNAAVWQKWWNENASRFPAGQRYRFGRPYTPLGSLGEVASAGARGDDRARAAFEVAVTVEGGARLDLDDWVARQEQTIGRIGAQAEKTPYPPGGWPGDRWRVRSF
jgi:hypothetical protein